MADRRRNNRSQNPPLAFSAVASQQDRVTCSQTNSLLRPPHLQLKRYHQCGLIRRDKADRTVIRIKRPSVFDRRPLSVQEDLDHIAVTNRFPLR